jgi:hypothetical protein
VKLLVLAVFISILIVLPDQVNAKYLWDDDYDDDERLEIVVIEATYLDYDDDGLEDDIITVFQIITPDDEWINGRIDVSCAIQKPSGKTLAFSFDFRTRDGAEITLVWFNFADEPGWYTLYIKAAAVDNDDVGPAYIKHVFDPPGGKDPMPPSIDVIDIKEL